jgi:heme/copper-type cytochrome/quinol oxidase subunit 2
LYSTPIYGKILYVKITGEPCPTGEQIMSTKPSDVTLSATPSGAMSRASYRIALIVGIAGLVVGILIGWLVIGWLLWPVQYVGEAYSYELSMPDKIYYIAALADSYSLRRQIDLVHQRLLDWPLEDKVIALAELYAQYERQGMAVEARQIVELAGQLKQVEGWDASLVNTALNSLIARYFEQGNREHAQFISLFGNEIGLISTLPGEEVVAPTSAPPSQAAAGAVAPPLWLILIVGLILIVLVALAVVLMRRRHTRGAPSPIRGAIAPSLTVPLEPGALLSTLSTYELGMDNFDESFSIEEEGVFKGECGMGISEVMGNDRPRKVTALEIWLFDKGDIRTITKVLASEHAYNDDALRNRLSARGETLPARPGMTLSLETATLALKATVLDVEYGESEEAPPQSFFKRVSVALSARPKVKVTEMPEATTGVSESVPPVDEPGEAPSVGESISPMDKPVE